MLGFSVLDWAALAWFVSCWIGYIRFADYTRWHQRSVSAQMDEYRCRWMRNMLRRELKVIDTGVQGNLLQGVAFFASTAIFVLGGLIAALGAGDRAMDLLSDLPFAVHDTQAGWKVKILLLVVIFVYAFFKFAWCYRLFNYCSILIGAAPLIDQPDPKADAFAEGIARIHGLAARHFNGGLRAYSFALGALGWFIHPLLFIIATAWVTGVLYRREFRSRSLRILRQIR